MKRRTCVVGKGTLCALVFVCSSAYGWGWEAHRIINRAAFAILPVEMRELIEHQREHLALHGPDPDHWKSDPEEYNRHWIDLELGDADGYPYANLPHEFEAALAKYGADSLRKIGVLPWHVQSYFKTTVDAMKHPSDSTIIVMAALGHYVADMHMPLHTTVNYDGQRTGNRGIHFRFEWWMIEQNRDRITLKPGLHALVTDPLGAAWQVILASHTDIDTMLRADSDVRRTFRPPIDSPEGRRQADPEYDQRVWERLGGLAVYRMNLSAQAVAGYWYAAWVEAGRPDLRNVPMPPPPPSDE